MLELLLFLCLSLPIAWLASEFQRHRWVSIVLGIAAIGVVGFVAYGWAALTIKFEKNLYFGDANEKLFKSLSDEMERGHEEQVRRELRRLAKNYRSSYENYPRYDEAVDDLVSRLRDESSADLNRATGQITKIAADSDDVSVSGTYNGSGKFGPFIRAGDASIYLVADASGVGWPDLEGQQVTVRGNLRVIPGTLERLSQVPVAETKDSRACAGAPVHLELTTTPDSITGSSSHSK
jgi:hypothetical protein